VNQSLEIQPVSWQEGQPDLEAVRIDVFVMEQHVPQDIEMDDRDASCLHVLAKDKTQPIGTGRIDIEKQGKIGRVAVLQEYRGQGVGKAIMDSLETMARKAHLSTVWLNAQISAQPFYEHQGYVPSGDTFLEANIPHCRMEKKL